MFTEPVVAFAGLDIAGFCLRCGRRFVWGEEVGRPRMIHEYTNGGGRLLVSWGG